MWYTPNAQLTYNRIFNFVIGVRGGGKTFNTLLHAIKRFEKTGEEFIYLRRRVIDLEDACYNKKNESGGDLFSDIRNKGYFKHADLKVTKDGTGGFYFYYNERIMGYGKALSTARRSTPLDRKSTRLNSSHVSISYAVFCVKKKMPTTPMHDHDNRS